MVEESDTPGGERPGSDPTRRMEGSDLLAERRALRAAESGEAALVRRAEAAEATVHTLERHVTSLQQRLGEAEGERQRLSELLEAERTVAVEREGELRRVKQREYAEQQLRVEAEDRLVGLDRDSRAELQELRARLEQSERVARELGERLETMQRELAEAEQTAAAEHASARRADGELHTRVGELELRTAGVERGLQAERGAREGSERALEGIREGHRRMETVVRDVRGAVGRLGGALAAEHAPPPQPPAPETPRPTPAMPAGLTAPPAGAVDAAQARGAEMADALAAAVERLRARADAAPPAEAALQPIPAESAAPRAPLPPEALPPAQQPRTRPLTELLEPPTPSEASAAGAAQTPAPAPAQTPAAVHEERIPHKHSMSLIGRIRFRRKQRRAR